MQRGHVLLVLWANTKTYQARVFVKHVVLDIMLIQLHHRHAQGAHQIRWLLWAVQLFRTANVHRGTLAPTVAHVQNVQRGVTNDLLARHLAHYALLQLIVLQLLPRHPLLVCLVRTIVRVWMVATI